MSSNARVLYPAPADTPSHALATGTSPSDVVMQAYSLAFSSSQVRIILVTMPFESTCLSRATKVFPSYSEEVFVVDNDIKNGEQNEEVLSQKNMVQALDALSNHVR
jgi:hypothetical protein